MKHEKAVSEERENINPAPAAQHSDGTQDESLNEHVYYSDTFQSQETAFYDNLGQCIQ